MATIRIAQAKQYEEILRFLEVAFNEGWRSFPRHQPSWWQPESMDYQHTFLMMEEEQIVSLVRLFPLDLHLAGARVKVAGIGAVSTASPARGQGHMSALLNHSEQVMRKEGIPLAILWGDRHRYRHFGYEIANRSLQFHVNSRGLAASGITPITPCRCYGQSEYIKNIAGAYNRHPYRRERTMAEFQLLFERVGLLIFVAGEDDKFGYLVLSQGNSSVMEFGGNHATVLSLAAAVIPMCGLAQLIFPFPNIALVPEAMLRAASHWTISPVGMMKIIDLPAIFELFSTQQGVMLPARNELAGLSPQSQLLHLFSTWDNSVANTFVWPLDSV